MPDRPVSEEFQREGMTQYELTSLLEAYLRFQAEQPRTIHDWETQAGSHYDDINKAVERLKKGICNGYSSFFASKIASGKFNQALEEINSLKKLTTSEMLNVEYEAVEKDGEFDIQRKEAHFTKEGVAALMSAAKESQERESSLRFDKNPLVALLEGLISNMILLQASGPPYSELNLPFKHGDWPQLQEMISMQAPLSLQFKFPRERLRKEELAKVFDKMFAMFKQKDELKTIRLVANEHATLVFKRKEGTYCLDSNNGVLEGPFSDEAAPQAITDFLARAHYAYNSRAGNQPFDMDLSFEIYTNESLKDENGYSPMEGMEWEVFVSNLQFARPYEKEREFDNQNMNELQVAIALGKSELVIQMIQEEHEHIQRCLAHEPLIKLFAHFENSEQCLKKHLYGKSVFSKKTRSGDMAIHFAARAGNADVIKALLAANVDINPKHIHNKTPFHDVSSPEVAKLLVDKLLIDRMAPLILNQVDYNGMTPILYAAQRGKLEVLKILYSAKADMMTTNKENQTALHLAVQSGHTDMVKWLLDIGINPNQKDEEGNTALHYASIEDTNMIILLLSKGASVSDKNKHGETPADKAREYYEYEVEPRPGMPEVGDDGTDPIEQRRLYCEGLGKSLKTALKLFKDAEKRQQARPTPVIHSDISGKVDTSSSKQPHTQTPAIQGATDKEISSPKSTTPRKKT